MTSSKDAWGPYAAGAGIGVLSWFAVATAGRPLGVTSAFESVAALLARTIAPDVTQINKYMQASQEAPKIGWEVALLPGIVLGSYLGSRQSTRREPALSPLWEKRFGSRKSKRYASAALGGALVMFGARMARGCTSGHGISGMLQLAASSWVFTPLIFATGVLTAMVLYGKEPSHARRFFR